MKRSEINTVIRDADAFLRAHQFYLPPFAYWTPDDWRAKGEDVYEIYERRLGWDLTDFGQGDFENLGLTLFTIRNGEINPPSPEKAKTYAEKILIVDDGQVTPMHFHWHKMEDIINRGGGDLLIEVYNATPDHQLADTEVVMSLDGVKQRMAPGTVLELKPGESVTLEPYHYHKFWGRGGRVLVGEVSKVNDDSADNCFLEPLGRFPTIEEDEPPLYLLVNDYEQYYPHARK